MKTKKTIKMNIPDYWGVGNESLFKSTKLTPNKKSKSAMMSLGQGQPLNSQMWTKGTQFSWTKDKPISKKNMNYKQANQFFSLCPIGDADKDGVPNWRDCRPYDSTRQGKHIDAFKKKLTGAKEKLQTKIQTKTPKSKKPTQTKLEQFSKEAKQPDWHMLVKFPDKKWQKVATLKQGKIKSSVEEYKETFPDVEVVQVTQDARLLGQLNRKIALQKTKKAVTGYVERQGFKSNIKEGLKPRGSIGRDTEMDDFEELPDMPMGGGPPIPIGSPSVGLMTPPPSLREAGGPAISQSASPQQSVNINMPPQGAPQQSYGQQSLVEPHEEEVIEPDTSPEDEDLNADINEEPAPSARPSARPSTFPKMGQMMSPKPQQPTDSQRKVPPGAQRYNPVTMEQSTIRRPLLRAPHQDQKPRNMSMGGMGGKIVSGGMLQSSAVPSSRPTGIMPMVDFKQAPAFRFMKFGKRVDL